MQTGLQGYSDQNTTDIVRIQAASLTRRQIASAIEGVTVEFDAVKNRSNLRKHGVSLRRAERMDFASAAIRVDDRENYGELRYQAIGFIGDLLHTLVFTMRGDVVRVISLRKADTQEAQQYAEEF